MYFTKILCECSYKICCKVLEIETAKIVVFIDNSFREVFILPNTRIRLFAYHRYITVVVAAAT